MKNKFLFLAIFLFVGFAYAQNYSQKYNDLYKRTEFYNSNGTMIGYAKYNDLYWYNSEVVVVEVVLNQFGEV